MRRLTCQAGSRRAPDSLDLNNQINGFDFFTLLNSTKDIDFKWSLDTVTRDVFQRTID